MRRVSQSGEKPGIVASIVARQGVATRMTSGMVAAVIVFLFALIPGLEVKEMTARCCGIAGTYGLKAEKYEIAMSVGRPLFDQIRDSGASTVACDSETCRWQITSATLRPSVHPIDYLYRAYGLDGGASQ